MSWYNNILSKKKKIRESNRCIFFNLIDLSLKMDCENVGFVDCYIYFVDLMFEYDI